MQTRGIATELKYGNAIEAGLYRILYGDLIEMRKLIAINGVERSRI